VPDWRQFVAGQLAQWPPESPERQEIIEELASHLEETYEHLRHRGASHSQALQGALAQVENWKKLRREILTARTKEHLVNLRTSRLWIPCVVTLGLSVLTLVGFALLRINPGPFGSQSSQDIWWSHLQHGSIRGLAVLNEYTAWLIALPFIGALGAFLSSRAGGRLAEVLVSGAFPALAWLAIVSVVLAFAASLGPGRNTVMQLIDPPGIITLMVLVPAACLLLGVAIYRAAARVRPKSVA